MKDDILRVKALTQRTLTTNYLSTSKKVFILLLRLKEPLSFMLMSRKVVKTIETL